MDTLLQDLRYAIRILLKTPGFTIVAVLTLALGIGATTAMFTVVNGVLLSPLPYFDSAQLVVIRERIPKLTTETMSMPAPDVLTYQRETKSFTDVAGYQPYTMDLTGLGQPRNVETARITWNTLPVLGVQPLIGRNFTAEEDRPGSPVALISHRMWKEMFGADPAILGRTVTLNRQPKTIVGVMPPSFTFPLEVQKPTLIFTPMGFTDDEKASIGDNFDYYAVARLKPGISIDQAQADVERVAQIIREGYPTEVKTQFEMHGAVLPLAQFALGDYRRPMLIMMVAVIFVLLIALANVANLLLAKGSSRQRELAIRVALGAGSKRIFSQLLTESVLLGIVGGIIGIVLADAGTRTLLSIMPASVPRLHAVNTDWTVLFFALAISLLSGIAFGVAPALFAQGINVNEGLKDGGRGGMQGRHHRHLRTAFVVAQFSLALMLLVGAGLLIRSFKHVLDVDPGFRADHVVSAALSLPRTEYKEPAQRSGFYKELMRRLGETPGVQFAGASTDLPLEFNWNKIFTVEGQVPPPGAGLNTNAHAVVLGDYFQAMGIPLIRGRMFTANDNEKSTKAVIISKSMADRYFAGDPIGQRIKWGPPESKDPWLTVTGVVGDVKQSAPDAETRPHTYQSYLQYPSGIGSMNIAARTPGAPSAAISALNSAVQALDPQLPLTELRTMEHVLSESTAPRRFNMLLVMVFAATAILLASVGLYGVVSFAVEQRTREIGIRMTLGATEWNVLKMLLNWALLLAGAGIVVGTVAAFGVTHSLSGFLFGIRPHDPLTFIGVALLLAAVSLLASYIPARRATKVDPMVALRYE
jgi:predicted permease